MMGEKLTLTPKSCGWGGAPDSRVRIMSSKIPCLLHPRWGCARLWSWDRGHPANLLPAHVLDRAPGLWWALEQSCEGGVRVWVSLLALCLAASLPLPQ